MSRYHDRLITAGTVGPKPPPTRDTRMTRTEIENLIRATVLPGGHRISAAAVSRIADAWLADADVAYDAGHDAGYAAADCRYC